MREVLVEKIPPPHEIDGRREVWFDKKGRLKRSKHYYKNACLEAFFKNGILDGGIDTPCVVGTDGYMAYYTNNKLHRGIFEPAEICPNGIKKYYVHGELRFEVDPNRSRKIDTRKIINDTLHKLYSTLEDGINK